jgi:hypothetical protein
MPNFSTFSIFEKEMRGFIAKVSDTTPLDKDKLTTWFYSQGVFEFRKGQAVQYYDYVEENIKKFNHRPLISKAHTIGQIQSGFIELKNAFLNEFGKDHPELKDTLKTLFIMHLYTAHENHLPFMAVQTEVGCELNEYQDKNGKLEPIDALKLTIKIFEAKRAVHPELEEDFNNQLALMGEFLKYLENQPSVASA